MKQYRTLVIIIIILGFCIWADLPNGGLFGKDISTHLGLDLVGGVQALLQAQVPAGTVVSANDMAAAQSIVENRVNGLGVNEAVVQRAGGNRIVVEIPGVSNPDEAIATIKTTGLLEFVDMSSLTQQDASALVGTTIKTDWAPAGTGTSSPTAGTTPTVLPSGTPTTSVQASATPTTTIQASATATTTVGASSTVTTTNTTTSTATTPSGTTWHTIMTGADLSSVNVETAGGVATYEVAFTLSSKGAKVFGDFTSSHVGQVLAIVLDKKVISVPTINQPITDGKGVITGGFTQDSANALAVQLRSGSLPIPLEVVETNSVGPSLGEESLHRSLIAGGIGLGIVILFMALYYRLPGLVADLALITYAVIAYAVFRIVPITLTLPGIAGFVLSIGMAVDANILIFERLKEELRAGRLLRPAIDLGWTRAWPSIRDSNASTLLTCGVLYIFGSAYGASIVKGFSLTLAIGVGTSLFTAIIVTRTFLHTILDNIGFREHHRWFGVN
jgi:preprotein translocase subunit SecD